MLCVVRFQIILFDLVRLLMSFGSDEWHPRFIIMFKENRVIWDLSNDQPRRSGSKGNVDYGRGSAVTISQLVWEHRVLKQTNGNG